MNCWRIGCTILVALSISLASCQSWIDRPETAHEVAPRDFSQLTSDNASLDIVQVPGSVVAPPTVETDIVTERVGDGERVTTQERLVERAADGSSTTIATLAPVEEIRIKPGENWTIDSLVGQINGRPVYASLFMQSIEDRILRIVAENPRQRAQRMIEDLIAERFRQYIDNELIIAEAEGMLTPEMQEGIFAWLQGIQEQTVAGYGGNRASATQTLQDQFGMNMEQYLKEKRDEALAQDLLRRRVKPRTIVSWRDVERQYSMLDSTFNPEPKITIGRIRLSTADELQIKDVEERLLRNETFAQVADALHVPENGRWQTYQLPPNGIAGLELAQDIRDALSAVENGKATAPMRKTSTVSWYCVMDIEAQLRRSIFESMLQRQIRRGLEDQRARYEQFRYLSSLRDRWVTNDIDQMTRRLTTIAWDRYLPDA
ncbi:MAG: hypothetical protein EXS15_00645 [Phycisphaerales bacterium]|nr:hypothetical protein [Phycisphaerales bacterium]